MSEFLSSKVLVTEDPPRTRIFPSATAAVTGMVGIAEKGPVGVECMCTSFDDYRGTFGGFLANSDLPTSAYAFFANGGSRLHVVRTAHYRDIADADSLTATTAAGRWLVGDVVVATAKARSPGNHGNGLRLDIRPHDGLVDIDVSSNAKRLETWRGLSESADRSNFYATVINAQSQHIRVQPAEATDKPLEAQSVMLAGGDDGVAGLRAHDFLGDAQAKSGMRALDRVLSLSLLAIPGASAEVQRGMVSYCEQARRGQVFALLDTPSQCDAPTAAAYVETEHLIELSEHAAIYWPRVLAPNPAPQALDGRHVSVPPSGFVAGVLARNAAARPGGVYVPPAGLEAGKLAWAVGLDHGDSLDESKRDIVYPARINPLSTGPGLPYFIDGSRTLKAGGTCPWVSQRRGMSFIERSLESRMQSLRHRPLNSTLLSEAYRETTSYLMAQLRDGAFASQNPKEAFVVAVPQSSRQATLELSVGLAFAQPAEFIWLRFSVDLGGPDTRGGF